MPHFGTRLAVAQWQQAEQNLDQFDWVHGHIYFDQIGRNFSERPMMMTMLRHPIERVLSLYKFYGRKTDLEMHERVKDMSFPDFVDQRIGTTVYASQLTASISYGEDGSPQVSVPETQNQQLRLAKQRLNDFDYIGITEHYAYSALLLSKELGMAPMWTLSSANSAPQSTTRADIDDDTLEKLKSYVAVDIQIYNHALELFKAKVRRLIGVLS